MVQIVEIYYINSLKHKLATFTYWLSYLVTYLLTRHTHSSLTLTHSLAHTQSLTPHSLTLTHSSLTHSHSLIAHSLTHPLTLTHTLLTHTLTLTHLFISLFISYEDRIFDSLKSVPIKTK